MLFHHKSDTIYQLRKKICYKIFLEIGECVLQKEQIFFRHIYKHSLNNTHQRVNDYFRFSHFQSVYQTDKMQTVK